VGQPPTSFAQREVAPVDFPAQPNRDLWLRLEPAMLRLFELDGDRLPASAS
jgi:hypothetical protein